jgi:hypothetical protein
MARRGAIRPGRWSAGAPFPASRARGRERSHRFPGDPFYAFALLQDPGRADRTSPLAVLPTPPPVHPDRRPQRVHNLEADTGLQHPLSTLQERRPRRPCKTRFRLAGCAFAGRGSNPLDRFERFQVYIPFSFPGLRLSQGWSTQSRPSAGRPVLAYLARYTHRVATANSRLVSLDDHAVRFRWKDYRTANPTTGTVRIRTMALSPDEFLRRFLLHILLPTASATTACSLRTPAPRTWTGSGR